MILKKYFKKKNLKEENKYSTLIFNKLNKSNPV